MEQGGVVFLQNNWNLKTTSRRFTPYSSAGGELCTLEFLHKKPVQRTDSPNHLHQAMAKPWRSLGVVATPLCGDVRRRIKKSPFGDFFYPCFDSVICDNIQMNQDGNLVRAVVSLQKSGAKAS